MFLNDHPQKWHVTLSKIFRWSLLQSTLSKRDSFGPDFPGVCFMDWGVHLIEVSVKRESTVLMSNLPSVHLGMASQVHTKNLKKKEEKFKRSSHGGTLCRYGRGNYFPSVGEVFGPPWEKRLILSVLNSVFKSIWTTRKWILGVMRVTPFRHGSWLVKFYTLVPLYLINRLCCINRHVLMIIPV